MLNLSKTGTFTEKRAIAQHDSFIPVPLLCIPDVGPACFLKLKDVNSVGGFVHVTGSQNVQRRSDHSARAGSAAVFLTISCACDVHLVGALVTQPKAAEAPCPLAPLGIFDNQDRTRF